MRKIHSTVLLLSMLFSVFFLTSCGKGDIEINPGSVAEGEVVITFNKTISKFPNYAQALAPRYLSKSGTGSAFLMMCPQELGSLKITYLKIVYPKSIPASSFEVGSTLEREGIHLLFADAFSGTQIAQYQIGSTKVVANDGKFISVAFENLKITTVSPVRNLLIHKGTIKFAIE